MDIKSKNPKISVIIPCFNHGDFLEETIESVLSQTFKDYEIIVVDDGSTDPGTLVVLDEMEKKYSGIKIIRQPNGGPANARNKGIGASSGELFFPLDADDTIDPRMLEKCHALISKDPQLGFVYTYTHFFGAEDAVWKNPEYNFYDLLWANQSTVSALVRKKAWEEVGGYDENKDNKYEDWDFWISLGERGWHGKLIKEFFFNYRKRKGESRLSASELKHDTAVKYIREKHKNLYAKESLNKIRNTWKLKRKEGIFASFDSRLEGAGLYDRELWKKHPLIALGRLVPVRVKRKVNSMFGKIIFDTKYYHRSSEE